MRGLSRHKSHGIQRVLLAEGVQAGLGELGEVAATEELAMDGKQKPPRRRRSPQSWEGGCDSPGGAVGEARELEGGGRQVQREHDGADPEGGGGVEGAAEVVEEVAQVHSKVLVPRVLIWSRHEFVVQSVGL